MKKRIVSTLLLIILLLGILSVTGCSQSYIMTANGEKMDAAYYNFYLRWQRDYYKKLLEGYGYDFESSLDNYYTETETVRQTIVSSAKAQYLSYIVVSAKFEEYGLALTDAQVSELEALYQDEWVKTYGEDEMKNILKELGLKKQEFLNLLAVEMKSNALLEYFYGENGLNPITEKDKQDYFKENYYRFKYVLLSTVDEENDALPPDEIQAKKTLANDICDQVRNGAAFEDMVEKYSEDYIKITDKMTEEEKKSAQESNHTATVDGLFPNKEGVFNQTLYNYYGISVNLSIIKELEKMNVGDVATVETDTSVWVIKKYDILEDPKFYKNRKTIIYEALYSDDFNSKYTLWLAELEYVFNEEALAERDPEIYTDLFTQAYIDSTSTLN